MASTDESWWALLEYGSVEIVIGSGVEQGGGFNATSEGIEGWYSTPSAKWDLTEKGRASGAFRAFDEGELLYAARTVKLSLYAEGTSRDEVVANHIALLGCAGRCCRLTVHDGGVTSYVTGYATVDDSGGALSSARGEVTLTLECPDPYRRECAWLKRYDWVDLQKSTNDDLPWYAKKVYSVTSLTGSEPYAVVELDAGEPVEWVTVQVSSGTTNVWVAASATGEDLIPAKHVTVDFRTGTATGETGADLSACFETLDAGPCDLSSASAVTLTVYSAVEGSVRLLLYEGYGETKWL